VEVRVRSQPFPGALSPPRSIILINGNELIAYLGSGGLAAANQVYNLLKHQGKQLADGDIAIIDVSHPCLPRDYQADLT
jgi:hypothetical protein